MSEKIKIKGSISNEWLSGYEKGKEVQKKETIKEIENWIDSLVQEVTKTDRESLKKFIHQKCLESPLNDIEIITNIVGLFTEFFQFPQISGMVLMEGIALAKIKKEKEEKL